MEDIILVTVDCLRADAISEMPSLQRRIHRSDWHHTTTYSTSHSTKWSCASFTHGQLYPEAFDPNTGSVATGSHLATVLSDYGYATGAFIAGNPNVNEYLSPFDEAWNGQYEKMNQKSGSQVFAARVSKLIRATKEIPANALFSRAKEWYENQDSPRFLWIHLMEPHEPYLPGFNRALSAGLLSTYRSVISQYRNNGQLSDRELRNLESLYWQTVGSIDDALADHFDWLTDDTIFMLSADHGEAFYGGRAGHHGWRDDVMTVPVVSNHEVGQLQDLRWIPTEILSAVDVPVPNSIQPRILTEGDIHPAFGGADFPTLVAISDKLSVKTDLKNDILTNYSNVCNGEPVDDLPEKLESALHQLKKSVETSQFVKTDENDISAGVNQRLKDLGYR